MLAANFIATKCQKKIRKLSIQILILGYLDKGMNQKYYYILRPVSFPVRNAW